MNVLLANVFPLAAAGYALLYLLLGGGFGGAALVFILAKRSGNEPSTEDLADE
jgi:hypothetical protein